MFNALIDTPIVVGRKLIAFLKTQREAPQNGEFKLQYEDAVNCLCKIYPNLHRHSAGTLLDELIFSDIVTSVKRKKDHCIVVPCS